MNPTDPGIEHSNLEREFFRSNYFLGQCSDISVMTWHFVKFFCATVNNFSYTLFDRLEARFCELSLLKVERQADALSEII